MTEDEIKFFAEVRRRSQDPDVMRQIINVATRGLEDKMYQTRNHAVDMEVVASMAMNARLFKGNEKFLADKLESWKAFNGLRWDDQITKLREKAK
jgi:hypothetical protein